MATRVTMRQDGDGSPLSVEAAANVSRAGCRLLLLPGAKELRTWQAAWLAEAADHNVLLVSAP